MLFFKPWLLRHQKVSTLRLLCSVGTSPCRKNSNYRVLFKFFVFLSFCLFVFLPFLFSTTYASAPNRNLSIGKEKFDEEDFESALKYFKKAVKEIPDNFEVNYYLGVTLYQLKDYEAAMKPLEDAVDLDTESGDAHFYLGLAYFKNNYLEDAEKEFETAAEYDTENGRIYYNLGAVYYKLNKLDSSIEAFEKAIELEEKLTDAASFSIALAYYEKGDNDNAKKTLNRILKNVSDESLFYTAAKELLNQITETE